MLRSRLQSFNRCVTEAIMRGKLSVLFFLCTSAATLRTLHAELRNPYVVETNSPQYFGDSQLVDGHYGLENYATSYENGYLHIFFTTTHDHCCFASYPPKLLIANKDPRLGYS